MEYSANCGGSFCPAIGSTGVISADHHLSLRFCFVLVSSCLRLCLTVLWVGSFRCASQLLRLRPQKRLQVGGLSGCETLFLGFHHGKENCSEEAEA